MCTSVVAYDADSLVICSGGLDVAILVAKIKIWQRGRGKGDLGFTLLAHRGSEFKLQASRLQKQTSLSAITVCELLTHFKSNSKLLNVLIVKYDKTVNKRWG